MFIPFSSSAFHVFSSLLTLYPIERDRSKRLCASDSDEFRWEGGERCWLKLNDRTHRLLHPSCHLQLNLVKSIGVERRCAQDNDISSLIILFVVLRSFLPPINCRKTTVPWDSRQLLCLSRERMATLDSRHRISNSSPHCYLSSNRVGQQSGRQTNSFCLISVKIWFICLIDEKMTRARTSHHPAHVDNSIPNDRDRSHERRERITGNTCGTILAKNLFSRRPPSKHRRSRERRCCSIDLANLFLFSSYLSWKRKKKEHAERERNKKRRRRDRKSNKETNTRAQKKSTVSTYEIKVRNKEQGTCMLPTKMFANEIEERKTESNKQIKNNMYVMW